ncbi:cytochrome P450 [Deinococcus proteolyticus MRP]|uniref:Cytochrome P450 n=1 Tax=Deinococcus proteolyticus (strain ATCC 35074 / DSM 20540 / JCM 6276 / NBRC 101906 / NCIMB 13154 / VKM Ac-1939 / CCM 2703 / MRP) TaxID=693977 RepID=F0RNE1_DEIPM|nr:MULTISPECIES: cytochrome P450 [Deinococcus]ADY26283.1 cytochrome P450 [Deinococcus proteolyticus MRP]MCY1702401.1 cytochrome P450 [Deinococcus sp. SL84]
MTHDPATPPSGCPFHGGTHSLTRRESLPPERSGPPVQRGADGVYSIGSFELSRQILRSDDVAQAGFMAESARQAGGLLGRPPVLYAEGEHHHEMRRSTARYFTPKHVAEYQPFIAALSDELIGELWQKGELNLDDLSLRLAVQVAAQVIGLTDSALPGMEGRITAFVESGGDGNPAAAGMSAGKGILMQGHTLNFFLLDVKPAIAKRRRQPKDDLISYLIERGYSDLEILTECLTYGTAGMVTTREFISAAAWHLLHNPELRAEYLHSTENDRVAILHEILRLEPVVTQLFRRVLNDIEVGGETIPAGSVVALNVQQANVDETTVGEDAESLCPHRPLPRGVQPPVLSFGDGHHRCPGAFLAIREADVFLRRLLIWNDLELRQAPEVGYNEVVKGYELRGLKVRFGAVG